MEAKVARLNSLQLRQVIQLATKSKKPRTLPTVQELTSLSPDTIKRKHPDRVVHLSEGRVGMTIGNALKIAEGK
jgi:hypothetical protein